MPYIKKLITNSKQIKAYEVLMKLGYSLDQAQRLIDKKRLYCNENLVLKKNEILEGDIFLIDYECKPKGLMPIFENEEFAVFDKPSGVLSHPNGRNCQYSMNDEIWYLFSKEAGVAHRLDKETSGVLVVAKNLVSQNKLKTIFEKREVSKEYHALVQGRVDKDLIVDASIGNSIDDDVKIRMQIRDDGKRAVTKFQPVKYFANIDATLVKALPITGRQHQIRLHLFHVKHKILGEPLYDLPTNVVEDIMDNKLTNNERIMLTGASRLCLHASKIAINFDNKIIEIETKEDFEKEFLNSISKIS